MRLILLFFIAFLTLYTPSAPCQFLIIQTGDNHTAYDRAPDFLKSVEVLRSDYLKANPNGQVILMINGDFGGVSAWSQDRGWMGIEMLRKLTEKYLVMYNLGNHDGFDWGIDEKGNELVYSQLRKLKDAGVHLLMGNIVATEETKNLFEPFLDLQSRSGRITRFVGLALEIFFKKSNWNKDSKRGIFKAIENNLASAKRHLEIADRERVEELIFFQHEGVERSEQLSIALQAEAKKQNLRVKMPVLFAAHDHLQASLKVGQTVVVDSQSNYDFSTVEIDSDGRVAHSEFFPKEKQSTLAARVQKNSIEFKFSEAISRKVEEIRLSLSQTLGKTRGFSDVKWNLKKGRAALGTALAESLRLWVQNTLGNVGGVNREIVSFYNSSSYRRDDPIPEGNLTRLIFESFYPFPGHAKIFEMNGAEVQTIFKAIRLYRINDDGLYTPQMSKNLSEGEGFQLIIDQGRSSREINPHEIYWVALDPWTSANGYQIPEVDIILKDKRPLKTENITQVFLKYGPTAFKTPRPYQASSLRSSAKKGCGDF